VGRFLNADSIEYLDPETINGCNLYAYGLNNPIEFCDPSGCAPKWVGNLIRGIGIIVGTALFVAAIVASAGAVGALAGVGAAAIGLTTTVVSSVVTGATVTTYVVAGGVALFGVSDAIEAFSGGTNPIRDYLLGGNQKTYDKINTAFNVAGSVAVALGAIAPKILQKIAKCSGLPKISKGKIVGYEKNFFDKNGNWNFRIDATTHGYPKTHTNPHYHVIERGGNGFSVYYVWETIWNFLKKLWER